MNETRRPCKGRVLLKKINEEERTKSGLFLATSVESPLEKCVILAHGEVNQPFPIGDLAYITKHAGVPTYGCHDEVVVAEHEVLYTEPKQ